MKKEKKIQKNGTSSADRAPFFCIFFMIRQAELCFVLRKSSIQHTRIMVSRFLALGENRSSWGR